MNIKKYFFYALTGFFLCVAGKCLSADIPKTEATQNPTQIEPATVITKECKPTSYPPTSIRQREEGKVKVKVLVDKTGKPIDAVVFASSGFARLDNETVKYFTNCKYIPATENSEPINAWQIFEYTWRIQNLRPAKWKE